MPWTADPLNDPADAVRALVGDTDPTKPLLPDETYELILVTERNVNARAAMACRVLAAKYAREVNKRVGDLWREAKQLYDHFSELAKHFQLVGLRRALVTVFVGGVDRADVESRKNDSTQVQPSFSVGMTDAVPSDLNEECP